jgi:hypothetical protein
MMNSMNKSPCVAVVIPHSASAGILGVIGWNWRVHRIYVIDDACPEASGDFGQAQCRDPRRGAQARVNGGVGAASSRATSRASGWGRHHRQGRRRRADGSGVAGRLRGSHSGGRADYLNNRFFNLEGWNACADPVDRQRRPVFHEQGVLGCWDIFDPTNGYTAVHAKILRWLPLEKIDRGICSRPTCFSPQRAAGGGVGCTHAGAMATVNSMNISRTAGRIIRQAHPPTSSSAFSTITTCGTCRCLDRAAAGIT